MDLNWIKTSEAVPHDNRVVLVRGSDYDGIALACYNVVDRLWQVQEFKITWYQQIDHNIVEWADLDTETEKMEYIIVIRGVAEQMFEMIIESISRQCRRLDYFIPVFAYLPGDEPAIEIVWTDAEMELKHLEMIANKL